MNLRNLKQVDILNLTKDLCEQYNVKFNKSDLSQYVSGKTEPNQDKLFILSKALNVDVTWLMGYDVPMNKENNIIRHKTADISDDEILSIAAHRTGHEGKLSEEELDRIKLAIKVALAKNNK